MVLFRVEIILRMVKSFAVIVIVLKENEDDNSEIDE